MTPRSFEEVARFALNAALEQIASEDPIRSEVEDLAAQYLEECDEYLNDHAVAEIDDALAALIENFYTKGLDA